MPGTPKRVVRDRIEALQIALNDAFRLVLQSSRSLNDGIGEKMYASLYNSLRAEAEKITGEESPIPKAPSIGDAGGPLGVVSALKVLTAQLDLWLEHTPSKAQP